MTSPDKPEPKPAGSTGPLRQDWQAPRGHARISAASLDIDLFYWTLVNNAPDAIVYADVGGMIRFWNGGAERILGYTASEALGKSLDIIIPN
jgi:PAS domain-containing protein